MPTRCHVHPRGPIPIDFLRDRGGGWGGKRRWIERGPSPLPYLPLTSGAETRSEMLTRVFERRRYCGENCLRGNVIDVPTTMWLVRPPPSFSPAMRGEGQQGLNRNCAHRIFLSTIILLLRLEKGGKRRRGDREGR